ncbi:MAG: hypothetical protein LUD82_07915, partial [Clostridiales bacterium]|nr:hypothetical protein [Clostridiales bacterium]
MLQVAAVAVVGSACTLLLNRQQGELALLLGLGTCGVVLYLVLEQLSELIALIRELVDFAEVDSNLVRPPDENGGGGHRNYADGLSGPGRRADRHRCHGAAVRLPAGTVSGGAAGSRGADAGGGAAVRRWSALAAAALLLWLACVPAAEAADIPEEVWDAAGADAVAEAGEDVVEQELDWNIDLAVGLNDLLDRAVEELETLLKAALRSGVLLLLTVLLAEMMAGLGAGVPGGWKDGVRVIAALTITGLAVADAGNLIDLGRETIQELDAFTQILTPVMATACAAAGNATGAAVRQAATLLCSSVLMSLVNRLFLPLVYGYIAMTAGACATGNRGLSAVAGLLKWCVTAVLKGVLMVYTAFLSFASLAAGETDAMTARLTKSAISGLVPVVGGHSVRRSRHSVGWGGDASQRAGYFRGTGGAGLLPDPLPPAGDAVS